ncbi:putative toxin-antitoxin system toxin component, PIN family [Aequorivita todarodis]|uniref:putative toxin-antitoxin system toxin component, PIN family n=1 Tax=Aequorivita todarodis TaxID=2036821 RepID=UPI002350F999|nr:putative toxin-antitoxin system toxin component, PIN family [Aequorivita todarodis]MDC8000531.1 putative toxin-antitoxin system toxin component, PIN family [Aequorivita todarodis]
MSKRIIVDTNLWISFLITRKYQAFKNLIISKNITLLFSSQSVGEFWDVSQRTHLQQLFPIEEVQILFAIFKFYGTWIEPTSDLKICRDGKDNFLLNLAVDGKADYLITGDKDLLILKKVENTKIRTYSEFVAEMEKQ